MEFEKLVNEILKENTVAGGIGSAFGPNVTTTAAEFSGPRYAGNDARSISSLYGGILTRKGTKGKSKPKKKSKQK